MVLQRLLHGLEFPSPTYVSLGFIPSLLTSRPPLLHFILGSAWREFQTKKAG